MAKGRINANERIADKNGRLLNINHKFTNVQAPEVGQVTAGIKAQNLTKPTDGPQQPTQAPRLRGLFG